jgi:hypothetical protein
MQEYLEARTKRADVVFTMHAESTTLSKLKTLDHIINDRMFTGSIYEGFPNVYGLVRFVVPLYAYIF